MNFLLFILLIACSTPPPQVVIRNPLPNWSELVYGARVAVTVVSKNPEGETLVKTFDEPCGRIVEVNSKTLGLSYPDAPPSPLRTLEPSARIEVSICPSDATEAARKLGSNMRGVPFPGSLSSTDNDWSKDQETLNFVVYTPKSATQPSRTDTPVRGATILGGNATVIQLSVGDDALIRSHKRTPGTRIGISLLGTPTREAEPNSLADLIPDGMGVVITDVDGLNSLAPFPGVRPFMDVLLNDGEDNPTWFQAVFHMGLTTKAQKMSC